MKNNFILSAIIASVCLSFVFSSCGVTGTNGPLQGFQTTVSGNFNVPAIHDTLSHGDMGTGNFPFNIDSVIKSNTKNILGVQNIDSFRILSCTLTIQNPDTSSNFANFETSQVSHYTNTNTVPLTIGTVTNNPDVYATTLSIPVNSSVNLKNYISATGITTFTYTLGGNVRRITTKDLNVNINVQYQISVKP